MVPLIFNLGPTELLIILAILLLLFGGARLAGLGKSTGRALREFKEETKHLGNKDDQAEQLPPGAVDQGQQQVQQPQGYAQPVQQPYGQQPQQSYPQQSAQQPAQQPYAQQAQQPYAQQPPAQPWQQQPQTGSGQGVGQPAPTQNAQANGQEYVQDSSTEVRRDS